MRTSFAQTILKLAKYDKKIIFLTGDLGFNAFEPLQKQLKNRFINAGVAEHNMVTVAAGIAYAGFRPWIYSIAPFVTIKVLEELRNDVCFNRRNVKVVGLGGGYDYGLAGPTHHALQDVATMLTLPYMKIYAPGFREDVEAVVSKMHKSNGPGYLRLTKAKPLLESPIPYKAVRNIRQGNKITILAFGSIVRKVLDGIDHSPKKNNIDLWLISELPTRFPHALIQSIQKTKTVCVVEEHVQSGALGNYINELLVRKRINIQNFVHLFAKGYISKKYGDQDFYLRESGLDSKSIMSIVESMML